MNLVKTVLAPALMAFVMVVMTFLQEGMTGFAVFLNLEALVLVLFGTMLALSAAYPLAEIRGALAAALGAGQPPGRGLEILECAGRYAVAMGWIGTLFGLILVLQGVNDLVAVPRRFALALDPLLFGLVLAKLVLDPMARRLSTGT